MGDARIHPSILVRMNHCIPTHDLPRMFTLLCFVPEEEDLSCLVLSYPAPSYLILSDGLKIDRSELSAQFSLSGCTLVT